LSQNIHQRFHPGALHGQRHICPAKTRRHENNGLPDTARDSRKAFALSSSSNYRRATRARAFAHAQSTPSQLEALNAQVASLQQTVLTLQTQVNALREDLAAVQSNNVQARYHAVAIHFDRHSLVRPVQYFNPCLRLPARSYSQRDRGRLQGLSGPQRQDSVEPYGMRLFPQLCTCSAQSENSWL